MFSVVEPYFPALLRGLRLTLEVSASSVAIGLLIAILCAPLVIYGPKPVRGAIKAYVSVGRGLPELLVIFMVFYGGTVLLTDLWGHYVEVSAFAAGVGALSVIAGAYLVEVLRGALLDISQGQWEASSTLGLKQYQTFQHVIFPQMLVRALPGIGNQWLIILKDSALVSIIGLEDLMREAVVGAGSTHKAMPFYLTAAALYLCVSGFSYLAIRVFEKHLTPQHR